MLGISLHPKQFTHADIEAVRLTLVAILQRHHVQAAYLIGSTLTSTADALSDVDLAVLPPSGVDWLDWYNRVSADVTRLLDADNLDLILLDQAPLSLQARCVMTGERLIDSKTQSDWEERVLARYTDLAHWRRENWQITRRVARQGITSELNMVDQERVQRFVFLIRDAVRELKTLASAEVELSEKYNQALVEYYLRIACEAALDLGRHVIVKMGLGAPQEYRDVGRILGEHGIVPTALGKKIEDMAGLRNVLVHLYWDVDTTRLDKILAEDLDTFDQFIQHIFNYLDAAMGSEASEP